jgi:hypothetical protein
MPVGTHSFLISFDGNASYEASSDTVTVTVVPDKVEASAIRLDLPKFFPVSDGYRDVVHARGSRAEPLSVRIRIYDGSGRLVRTLAEGRATGGYSIAWNGRSTAGSLLPSGKYRFVQTLEDEFGTRRSVTSYVVLSHKRLVHHTTIVAKEKFTVKTSSWGGWRFTLPAATVYRSMRLEVYARSRSMPGAEFGAFDLRECSWSAGMAPGCVTNWDSIGTSTKWYGRAISPNPNRHGRYVRAFVAATYSSAVVYRARIRVTYSVLE